MIYYLILTKDNKNNNTPYYQLHCKNPILF